MNTKKIVLLATALLLGSNSWGADTKISALPAASALAGTETVPGVQSSANVKITPAQIDTYVESLITGADVISKFTGSCSSATVVRGNGDCAAVDLTTNVSGITPVANGGTNVSSATDDSVLVGNGTTWQIKALTSCSGATDAVTFNTSTNVFGCNTITGSLPSSVQGDIVYASGTNTYTVLNKNASATRYLSNTGTTNNPAWAQVNVANGVTGTLPAANGGLGITAVTDDTIPVASGSAWVSTALTTCTGAGKAVTYDAAANSFGCNTISSGGAAAVVNKITSTGNSAGSQTTLWSATIPAATLTADGQAIQFWVGGTFATSSNTNKRFTVDIGDGPTSVFDSNSFGTNTGVTGHWSVEGICIRSGATTGRCTLIANLQDAATTTPPGSLKSYAAYAAITSTWANTMTFQVTGNGTGANDTLMTMGKVVSLP